MDAVFADLCNPNVSLLELAESYKTTVEALIAWMSKPDIQQRLTDFQSASAFRTRLVATANLPKAVEALAQIIDAYIFEETKELVSPSTLAKEQRRRSRETARKASALLIRLARFQSPLPEGGGWGKGSLSARTSRAPESVSASPLSSLSVPPLRRCSERRSRADDPTPTTTPAAAVTSSLDHSVTSSPVPDAQSSVPSLSLHDLRALLAQIRERIDYSHFNRPPHTNGHDKEPATATWSKQVACPAVAVATVGPGSTARKPSPLEEPDNSSNSGAPSSHDPPIASAPP
jgi:hypothetical protein